MKRLTRTTRQNILVGMIAVVVIGTAFGVAYFVTKKQLKDKYEMQLSKKEALIDQNKRMAYVATEPIPAGSMISNENTIYQEVFDGNPTNYFITSEELGHLAVIDIETDTHIMKNMVAPEEIQNDLKEEEFSLFYMNSNLKENDYVDIRILFPNGENYVVLSKKSLKNLDLVNNGCFLWLSEDEILAVSSAIIDAYLHEGTKIYTSKYIEPSIQKAAKPNYLPSDAVMDLLQNDPNILKVAIEKLSRKARADLDRRLEEYEQNDTGGTIDWNAEPPTTYTAEDVYTTNNDSQDESSPEDGDQTGEDEIDYVD